MAAIASRKRAGAAGKKQRAQRQTSNVFAMFEQSQIHEFKEAFNMIDTNKDGFITAEDLREIYGNLGKEVIFVLEFVLDNFHEAAIYEAPNLRFWLMVFQIKKVARSNMFWLQITLNIYLDRIKHCLFLSPKVSSLRTFLMAVNIIFQVPDSFLEGMLAEASGAQMNFTMFLTLFGERLQGTDQEHVIKNAFACFDEDGKCCINVSEIESI